MTYYFFGLREITSWAFWDIVGTINPQIFTAKNEWHIIMFFTIEKYFFSPLTFTESAVEICFCQIIFRDL